MLQSRTGSGGTTYLWDPTTSPSRELKQGSDNIIYGLGPLYVVCAVVLGAGFLYRAVRLRVTPDGTAAMKMFKYSITYLALLFGAIAVGGLIR